jgi:hypothetical protein
MALMLVKRIATTGAIFLLALPLAHAQRLREKNIVTPIGPQAWHCDIYRPLPEFPSNNFEKSKTGWSIHVVEFDLRHPFLQLETVKAGDHLRGKERTSLMAARRDRDRHRIVAAINGDFYDTGNGIPINLQMRNGEILRQPTARSIFALSAAEKPFINFLSLAGSLQAKQKSWQTLHGLNRSRNADELIFFNHYFGGGTGTNNFGSEIRIQPLKKFAVNDTIQAVVREMRRHAGNASLDESTYIISGHGAAETWLIKNISVGDTIKFVWRIPETPWRLVEAIGGLPRLLRDGRISIESQAEGGSESFTNTRHPRTAIGFNADTSRFFFVTVDGRQSGYSEGMTLPELANFMSALGCVQALNLDGGGSTTMVVRGNVVNRPSDPNGERAVANALLLICTAPPGKLAQLDIPIQTVRLHAGEKFDFNITATDNFYNPLNLSDENVFWKVTKKFGKIDRRGLFTAGAKTDSGYVIAYRQQTCDSAKVVIITSP